jgi:serine phosphatase RsbU (regulator of sigma subunit)
MNCFSVKSGSLLLAFFMLLLQSTAQADALQTLKNLERERSSLIALLLDNSLKAEQRNQKIASKTRRLVDLERMVLRDSRLEGNTHTLVRRAFNDYDRTFLAHASVEQNKHVSGHWFDLVGLSNAAILNAQRGIR